jgi:hypothetical protein
LPNRFDTGATRCSLADRSEARANYSIGTPASTIEFGRTMRERVSPSEDARPAWNNLDEEWTGIFFGARMQFLR